MSARSPSPAAAKAADAALGPDRLAAVLAGVLPHLPSARIDAVARSLVTRFQPLHASPKVALLRQGEIWQHAYLIESGLVRMHFVDRDGHEFNKNFHAEGSLICPITPSMWQEPSLFGIHTVEATHGWVADAAALRAVLQEHALWRELQCELLARLLTGKLQREHDLLALDARQRHEAFGQRFPALVGRVPLKHLASFLGMTDVSLSRLRRADKARARSR